MPQRRRFAPAVRAPAQQHYTQAAFNSSEPSLLKAHTLANVPMESAEARPDLESAEARGFASWSTKGFRYIIRVYVRIS